MSPFCFALFNLLASVRGAHECDRYYRMYTSVYNDFKHWHRKPVTPAMQDEAIYKYTMEKGRPGFAFIIEDGKLHFHTSMKLIKHGVMIFHAAEITYQMTELQKTVMKYGHEIPNVEMVIMVNDGPEPDAKTFNEATGRKNDVRWAPVGKYFSADGYTHVAVPGWGFYRKNYDQNILSWSRTIFEKYPWESREGKLYGNYPEGYRLAVGTKETGEGYATKFIRKYLIHNVTGRHPSTVDINGVRQASMVQHAAYKYLAVVDGIGPSNRYFETLATGSLVFKMQSPYKLHFEGGMRPYEHYVPFWGETPWDAHDLVLWARENDDVARRIGEAGRKFAHKYLAEPARLCYWREVLLQLSKVLSYVPTVETRRGSRPVFTWEEAFAHPQFQEAWLHWKPVPPGVGSPMGSA